MQTFKLPTGLTVTTRRVPGTATIEFTTARRDGEVISTVHHSFADAVPLIKSLTCRGYAR